MATSSPGLRSPGRSRMADTYVFRLRAGLRWSDGEPLTAGHFADGLGAVTAPGSGARRGIARGRRIGRCPGRADPPHPAQSAGALPPCPALTAGRFTRASARREPGSAPRKRSLRLVRYVPGERIELERNPRYRDAAAVAIDRVAHLTLEDLNTELNLYRAGDLDVTSEVPNAQVTWCSRTFPASCTFAVPQHVLVCANLERLPDRDARWPSPWRSTGADYRGW